MFFPSILAIFALFYSLDYSFDVPNCLCSLRRDFTMFESLCFCKFREFSSIEWWAVIRFYFLRYTERVNTRSSTRIFYSAAVVVKISTTGYLAYLFHSTRIISLFGNGRTKSMLTLSNGPYYSVRFVLGTYYSLVSFVRNLYHLFL
jgi:hypothetical protein